MSKITDLETRPALLPLVDGLERAPEEQVPCAPLLEQHGAVTKDAEVEFCEAAGSWHELIDVDAFVEENYRQRLVSTRPKVDLLGPAPVPRE